MAKRSMSLPTIASFWHGPLSWLERLSMASFQAHGHRVDLYCYDDPGEVPDGVRLCDAEAVVPRERLIFYKGKGTPGVFSDLFRMHLLRQQRGIWADVDVYCVKPIPGDRPYLFGFERSPNSLGQGGSVNGAVLSIPHDAELLDNLLSIFDVTQRSLFEPHLPLFRRWEVAVRRIAGQKVPPEFMQYGATGPFALTYYVRRLGLEREILSREVFYPVSYEQIPQLMTTGTNIEDFITPATLGVHIWRSRLTARGRADIGKPEPGSALDTLCKRHAVDYSN